MKDGAKNRLREMDIHRIVDVCARQDRNPGYAAHGIAWRRSKTTNST
jgi:hypothetical protein